MYTDASQAIAEATQRYTEETRHHVVTQRRGGYFTVGHVRKKKTKKCFRGVNQIAWSTLDISRNYRDKFVQEGRPQSLTEKITQDDARIIYELLADGLSYQKVADKFDVTKQTIVNLVMGRRPGFPKVNDFIKQQREIRKQEKQ